MKTTLAFAAMFAVSLGIGNLAIARGGGGGGAHFAGGGAHFGNGGHFMNPSTSMGRRFNGSQSRGGVFGAGGRMDRHFYGQQRGVWFGGSPYFGDAAAYSEDLASAPDENEGDPTVAMVQQALAREGYYRAAVDGDLDLMTQDAIENYDRDHRLPVTGTITDALLSSLHLE